ncbi:DNRLRE domain-containing protein [Clostridiaceae bacterium M8S5]|nr:DNRLRE domain-containing protein [Clostridiaceae bacterium M8S5]
MFIRRKKILICLSVIVILIGAVFMQGNFKKVDADNLTPLRTWMEDSWSLLGDKRYCDIIIPGTHDSGTYSLSYKRFDAEQVSSKFPGELDDDWIPSDIRHKIADIIKKKSVCQNVDIYTQLTQGIRFLDIRFKRFSGDKKLRIFHGVFGEEIEPILNQVKKYMDETTNEIVFINLNRYGEMNTLTSEDKKEIGKITRQILGQYIVPADQFRWTMTLDDIVKTGKRLVINTEFEEIATELKPSLPTNYSVPQAQKGSYNYSTVIEAIKEQYANKYQHKTDKGTLDQWFQIKLQLGWQPEEELDPILDKLKKLDFIGAGKAIDKLLSSSIESQTNHNRSQALNLIKTLSAGADDNEPNVWMRDFYTQEELYFIIMKNFGKTAYEHLKLLDGVLNDIKNNSPSEDKIALYEILRVCVDYEGYYDYLPSNYLNPDENTRYILPTDDTYVDVRNSKANLGGNLEMLVKKTSSGHYTRYAMLKFNIKDVVTQGKEIEKATLKLTTHPDSTGSAFDTQIWGGNNDGWQENTINWSNGAVYYNDKQFISNVTFPPKPSTQEIDISMFVKQKALEDNIVTIIVTGRYNSDKVFMLLQKRAIYNKPILTLKLKDTTSPSVKYILPTDDTYVDVRNSNADLGSSPELLVKKTSSGHYTRDALYKFDLTDAIPSGKQIVKASLKLSTAPDSTQRSFNSNIWGGINTDWTEHSITYSNGAKYFNNDNRLLIISHNFPPRPTTQFIDITGYILKKLDEDDKIISIIVSGKDNLDRVFRLTSKEATSNKPYLVLEFK